MSVLNVVFCYCLYFSEFFGYCLFKKNPRQMNWFKYRLLVQVLTQTYVTSFITSLLSIILSFISHSSFNLGFVASTLSYPRITKFQQYLTITFLINFLRTDCHVTCCSPVAVRTACLWGRSWSSLAVLTG